MFGHDRCANDPVGAFANVHADESIGRAVENRAIDFAQVLLKRVDSDSFCVGFFFVEANVGDNDAQAPWQIRQRENRFVEYQYDFGDNWMHDVLFEGSPTPQPGVTYPQCLEGEHACPPEDVCGIHGFSEYLEAIADSSHERLSKSRDVMSQDHSLRCSRPCEQVRIFDSL